MKTTITLAASLAVMLCGCRGPHPFASSSELGGHKPESEKTSLASALRPAAQTREGRSDDNTAASAPVAELLLKAEQAIRANQLVVARSQLQSVLAQQPDQPRAHHLLAIIADQDGRFAEAEQHYFMAMAKDSQNSKIVGDLGYSYYLQSRSAESEQYLQRALELDPQNSTAARNLAQLYSDRDEISRAEHLLSSTLPPMEAQTALQQLRLKNAQNETLPASSQNSPLTPDELQQQLHNQMYATAGTQSFPDQRVSDAALTQGRTPADSFKPVPRDDDGGTPWMQRVSSIEHENTHRSATRGLQDPPMETQTRRESGALAHGYGAVQQSSDHWDTGDLPTVQPDTASRNTIPAAANRPVVTSEPRRWPPASWAPLTDENTSSERASSPPAYSRQPDAAAIQQVSGAVSPWNADVRHAMGQSESADVQHAYYENQGSDRIGRESIQQASLQRPNTPAAVPEWNSQPSGTRSRLPMGTDTAIQRGPAGPATGMPVVIPAGSAPGTQSRRPAAGHMQTDPSRQTYGTATNEAADYSYTRRSAASAAASTSEVPSYPFRSGVNSTSRASQQSGVGRSAWSAEDDEAANETGWMEGGPTTGAPMRATSPTTRQSTSNVIEPEPYQSRQGPRTTNSTRPSDGYQYRY